MDIVEIFINYYDYFLRGTRTTVVVSLITVFLGSILGCLISLMRLSRIKPLNWFSRLYITVIRGTPVVVQLMIMYYIIFASSRNSLMVAVLAFGINSGAYVAEIFRSGIMSVDQGQFEAGRSLGFNYVQTMRYIIVPQTIKNVLPSLMNEFIALLKETSVAGYVAVQDLTKAGDIIRSRTYSAFMPLIAVALIYLAIVSLLAAGVSRLERRLRTSER